MCVFTSICAGTLSLSLCIYIYVCIYRYIYIYIHTQFAICIPALLKCITIHNPKVLLCTYMSWMMLTRWKKNRNPVDAKKDCNMRGRIGGGLCLSIQLTSGRLSKLELELGKIQYCLLPKIILWVPSSSVTSVPLVRGDPYLEVQFQFSVDRLYIYIYDYSIKW